MPIAGPAPVRAPEFQPPFEWVNSPPLTLAQLRGRVLLIDIWDFTCINCLRTLPYLREWHRRYSSKGLTLIGIHAPEFRFAREKRQVAAAVERLGIEWPVLLDNEYKNWDAYANRYWPTVYLVDSRGTIRHQHSGEGGYIETEARIQSLLLEALPDTELPRLLEPLRDEDAPGAVCYRATPELSAGLNRGALGNPEGYAAAPVIYRLPPSSERAEGRFYVEGTWHAGREHLTFAGRHGRIVVPYHAASINAVFAPSADPVDLLLDLKEPAEAEVLLNGGPIPPGELGEDVYQDGEVTKVRIDRPRMYSIATHPIVRPRELEVVVRSPGLTLYSFTFTSCAV